jgi:hypothetical protein
MARKRILSGWIGLPGLAPPAFSDPGLWDITALLPPPHASMEIGATLVGPGTLQITSSTRIDGPVSGPVLEPAICFAGMREHNLRIASTVFGAEPTGVE